MMSHSSMPKLDRVEGKYSALIMAILEDEPTCARRELLAADACERMVNAGLKCECTHEAGDSPCVVHDVYYDLGVWPL
jgi:hypothetical protein